MTLKEETLKTALMGAMAAVVKDVNDSQRKQILNTLLEQYRETGNKSFSVFNPEGDKVAAITLNEAKPETVIADPDAFLDWCREYRPELIETVEHPPVEGWTETRVKGTAVAQVVEGCMLAGETYVTDEGNPVDGVKYRPAAEPSRFTLSYTAKDRGMSLVEAWSAGMLPVDLGPSLPQLGRTP